MKGRKTGTSANDPTTEVRSVVTRELRFIVAVVACVTHYFTMAEDGCKRDSTTNLPILLFKAARDGNLQRIKVRIIHLNR